MRKNMGIADRAIRIVIAIVIAILIFAGKVAGVLAIILGVVAGIFLFTGFVSMCPLYLLLDIKTNRNKQK